MRSRDPDRVVAQAPAGEARAAALAVELPGRVVDGNSLYILDGSTVRRMNLTSAAVTTWIGIAGDQGVQPGPLPALLNQPRGLVSLGQGQLLLTDEYAVVRVR